MGITTKTGDRGETSLYGGGRVTKDNIRVEACGTLDELCSFLGAAKSLIRERKIKKLIEAIQRELFVIGSEIATAKTFLNKLRHKISPAEVKGLERALTEFEKKRNFEECCFYLPGVNFLSSMLDIARTVTRRAERKVVTLYRRKIINNTHILAYLNRLSDLLYLLARSYEKNKSTSHSRRSE